MLPSMMRQPFVRKRFPRVLDHGNLVVDTTAPPLSTLTVYGSIQPAEGQVDLTNRDGAETTYVVWATPGADVQHYDIVEVGGLDYYVNGQPLQWATGILDHMVIKLSRWNG